MSFYRAPDLRPGDLAEYIRKNEDRYLIGYLAKALLLNEINDKEFIDMYIKLCTNDREAPMSLLPAKQYVALVNRVKHYEETGEDIIPEEVQVSKDEEACSDVLR